MATLTLIKQLNVLTAAEKRALRQHLTQKNSLENSFVGKLLDHLLQQPATTNTDRKTLSAAIFPDQAYNQVRIRDLITQLSQLLASLFIEGILANDKFLYDSLLAKAYDQRPMCYEFFRKISFRLIHKLEQQPCGMLEYLQLHQLHHHLYFHQETDKHDPGSLLLLQKAHYYYELSYLLSQQVYEAELAVRQQLLKTPDRFPFTRPTPPPLLQWLHDCRQLIYSAQPANSFEKLLTLLQAQQQQLPRFETRIIFKMLINFAGQRAAAGDNFFIKQLHLLHIYGLSSDLFINYQHMSSLQFSNVVIAALMAGQAGWARTFIETHSKYLPTKDLGSTTHYCEALLLYHQAQKTGQTSLYVQSQTLLLQIPYSNSPLDLRLRSLQVRLGYDYNFLLLDDFTLLDSWIRNFERHLRSNHTISNNRTHSYLFFLKILRKLVRLAQHRHTITPGQRERLLQIVEKSSGIYFHSWLQTRIRAL